MAESLLKATFKGVERFNETTKEIESRVDAATLSALRANQNKLKTAIRANLRGAPRWTEKGANRITGASFQVAGTTGQKNTPRAGGPGRMTGVLYKGVGAVRKPQMRLGSLVGGVGIGAKPNNVKKRVFEAKFPYFKPAVDKVTPSMGATFEKGWEKAIHKQGGIL